MTSALTIDSFLAEANLHAALADTPNDANILLQLAQIATAKREYAQALDLYDRLRVISPDDWNVALLRAQTLRYLDRLPEALAEAERIAAHTPQSYDAHWLIGDTAFALGQYQRARLAFGQCCMLRPTAPQPYEYLAASASNLRYHADAMRVRADIFAFTLPQTHEYFQQLIAACRANDQKELALAVARTAGLIFPQSAVIAEQLAQILIYACRTDEAEVALQRAEELGSSGKNIQMIRTAIDHLRGRTQSAIDLAITTAAEAPDDSVVRLNLGLLQMRNGQWQDGWLGYENRLQSIAWPDYDRLWQGETMDGTLLVVAEQGLGDQIQCLRYLPLIRPRVGRLVMIVSDSLVRLVQDLPGIDAIFRQSDPWPDYDRAVPMMSLGRLLEQGQPGSTPVSVPFLRPPAHSSVPCPTGPGLKVGICWAGNPVFPQDDVRSMPASEVARLIRRLPGIRFFSLHRGPVAPFVGRLADELPIVDAVSTCADYADTASVVDGLDLVITIDSSIAHLAGAMGKETWLLLPYISCFRWGQAPLTTPLYPSVRLFRQPHLNEGWAETMDQVADHLSARLVTYDQAFADASDQ